MFLGQKYRPQKWTELPLPEEEKERMRESFMAIRTAPVIFIMGPAGSGRSTLMNLVLFDLYGVKRDKMVYLRPFQSETLKTQIGALTTFGQHRSHWIVVDDLQGFSDAEILILNDACVQRGSQIIATVESTSGILSSLVVRAAVVVIGVPKWTAELGAFVAKMVKEEQIDVTEEEGQKMWEGARGDFSQFYSLLAHPCNDRPEDEFVAIQMYFRGLEGGMRAAVDILLGLRERGVCNLDIFHLMIEYLRGEVGEMSLRILREVGFAIRRESQLNDHVLQLYVLTFHILSNINSYSSGVVTGSTASSTVSNTRSSSSSSTGGGSGVTSKEGGGGGTTTGGVVDGKRKLSAGKRKLSAAGGAMTGAKIAGAATGAVS